MTCTVEVQMNLQSTLPNLLTFCAAFELGSYSKAARRLGVTPQAASRSVARLEDALGVTLFRRTTRSLTPTDDAHAYYAVTKEALDLLGRAEADLSRYDEARSGLVRLSAPTTFGHFRLLPSLATFRHQNPLVKVEVHIGNQNVNCAADGYDFAIRLGTIREKGLVARKLGEYPLGVYASPGYLAKRGAPRTPAQLVDHSCIGFIVPSSGRILPWTFAPEPKAWTPDVAIRCAGDVLATITLARSGQGLVQTYDFIVAADIERGLLVEVLRNFRGRSRPFSIVYPEAPRRTPAAQALLQHVFGATREG